ncbi:hypothetical protein ACFQS4_12110 [Saliphagus sp. GCM10025317]
MIGILEVIVVASNDLALGARVVDREALSPVRSEAVVVALHDTPADHYPIDTFGATVADVNPSYAPDESVATVALVADLETYAPDWSSVPIHNLAAQLQMLNVDLYTCPVERLAPVGGA